MNAAAAVDRFSALGQARRLEIFAYLSTHYPDGLKAGDIAKHFDQPASTMSSHLKILSGAGLVSSVRRGREIYFKADPEIARDLSEFLVQLIQGADTA